MSDSTALVSLNALDLTVAVLYFAVTIVVGFAVGRTKKRTSDDYFMGGRNLPWYVVAASMVATVIATEHFVAQVGAAYARGIVIAAFGWNAWIVYTLLIWIFLPYYMRTGLYTMPEFLERRYNPAARYLFAMFGMDLVWAIVLLGLLTGAYTIYGGLKSAAWTDFMQMGVLLIGGILVPVIGLSKVGG